MCTGTVFIIAHIPQHRPDRDVLKRGSEVSDVRHPPAVPPDLRGDGDRGSTVSW